MQVTIQILCQLFVDFVMTSAAACFGPLLADRLCGMRAARKHKALKPAQWPDDVIDSQQKAIDAQREKIKARKAAQKGWDGSTEEPEIEEWQEGTIDDPAVWEALQARVGEAERKEEQRRQDKLAACAIHALDGQYKVKIAQYWEEREDLPREWINRLKKLPPSDITLQAKLDLDGIDLVFDHFAARAEYDGSDLEEIERKRQRRISRRVDYEIMEAQIRWERQKQANEILTHNQKLPKRRGTISVPSSKL